MTDLQAGLNRLIERDQEAIGCPYEFFAQARDEAPLVWNESLGAWIATSYEHCREILRDTDTWSSMSPTAPAGRVDNSSGAMVELAQDPEMGPVFAAIMSDRRQAAVLLNADPPDHVRQRKAVNAVFRPRRIRDMEPVVQEVSDRLIAEFAQRGSVEFVGEYAVLLPMTIIAYALGVGDADLLTFKKWSDDMVMPVGNANPSVDQAKGFLVSTMEFGDFMSNMIDKRMSEPADDIISDVANAEVNGEPLSHAEKISMLTQFLVAGNETTTKMITNIALRFATDPELADRVRADRSLVEGMVEETLRFEAPVGGLFRQAMVDTEVGGVAVTKDQSVWVVYGAANRDGAIFECPADFDPARANARDHLAFGHGEHFCIGAGLARMEGVVATNAILDAMSNIAVADSQVDRYEDSYILRGLKNLELTFTPAAAEPA